MRVIAATQLHRQLRHFNLNLKLTVNSVPEEKKL